MATREEMMTALRNADAAGATEDAARIAKMIDRYDAETKSPAATPAVRKPLGKPEPLTWDEKLALQADKMISKMPGVGNQQLRQEGIDLASGAASTYRNLADVISPGAGEKIFPSSVSSGSGWETVGQVIDPVATVTGLKAYQAINKALPVIGALKKAAVGGGAAGAAATAPQAAAELRRGDGAGTAAGTLAAGTAGGAVLGPALTGAGIGINKVVELGKRWAAGAQGQVVDYLHKVFGNDTQAVAKALDELKGFVAGEQPTAGRAAVSSDQRFPQLKALEQRARTGVNTPTEFANRDVANEGVRTVPLEAIASSGRRPTVGQNEKIPMSPAETARMEQYLPELEIAYKDRVTLDDPLTTLLGGPEVRSSLRRGDAGFRQEIANAAAAGRPVPVPAVPGTPGRPGTPEIPAQFDSMGMPKSPRMPAVPEQPATPGNLSIEQLHNVSKQLKREIDSIPVMDTTGRRQRLIDAKVQLERMMEDASSAYAGAKGTYRQMSEPVNQAAVAEELLAALRNPSGVERPGAFLKAMEEAPKVIKKAGVPRFQQIEQVMSPGQMDSINALRQSALREQAYNNLESSPNMLPKMTGVADVAEKAMPNWLNVVTTTLRKALRTSAGYSDEQAQKILDQAMLDPAALSQLIKMMPSGQQGPLLYALGQLGSQSQGAVISSTMANALRGEQ